MTREHLPFAQSLATLAGMAWKIADYVERGEIDNRERDYVTGRIWLCGLDQPIQLDLVGNALQDLAGRILRFRNPTPQRLPADYRHLACEQQGTVGDITAARKVKVLDLPFDDLESDAKNGKPAPFHWANGLYLEWYSKHNGRVLIEATGFKLEVDTAIGGEASGANAPTPPEADTKSVNDFLDRIVESASQDPEDKDDAPQSAAEAEAEAEAADMDLLNDRILARLNNEFHIDADVHNRIIAEERARLRRERGLPELQPDSPEADEAEVLWLHEREAGTEELFEADQCPMDEERRHPLVEQCQELSLQLQDDIEHFGWAPEHATTEHPLHEITNSLCFAAAKLAGALNGTDPWPPDPYFAASTLVRLKKARRHLRDARDGLQAAREEKLATSDWIDASSRELESIRQSVQEKIETIRALLLEDEAEWS